MFFITKDGVKDWKEGDSWYNPSTVEGYEAAPSTGMSTTLKVIIAIFIAIIVMCGLYALFLSKKRDQSR